LLEAPLALTISPPPGLRIDEARLLCIYGAGLADCAARLRRDEPPFDLVVSRAVLEEIYDPAPELAAADTLLAPGGRVLHKVDLTDYGMFSDAGMHPLTFLTIPERLYRRMASDSGLPNRKRMGYYKDQVDALGYASRTLVTGLLGQGRGARGQGAGGRCGGPPWRSSTSFDPSSAASTATCPATSSWSPASSWSGGSRGARPGTMPGRVAPWRARHGRRRAG
jgi:hypothetical protein